MYWLNQFDSLVHCMPQPRKGIVKLSTSIALQKKPSKISRQFLDPPSGFFIILLGNARVNSQVLLAKKNRFVSSRCLSLVFRAWLVSCDKLQQPSRLL